MLTNERKLDLFLDYIFVISVACKIKIISATVVQAYFLASVVILC
jgi:hypothetical protein